MSLSSDGQVFCLGFQCARKEKTIQVQELPSVVAWCSKYMQVTQVMGDLHILGGIIYTEEYS